VDITEFRRAFTLALIEGDPFAAEVLIREAMDADLSGAVIDDEIIAPALYIIGELWEQGNISVADEHLATEIVVRVLALQREAQRVAVERGGHRVVLAAPRGELHVVALRMVHNLLHDAGYDVVMLGADVPTDALARFAIEHEPGAVCLSATMPVPLVEMQELAQAVRADCPAAGFVLGGRGFGGQAVAGAGVEVCDRVTEVVETIDAIVKRARFN
jgi:methanogenic corrinoid protein MtbC1